MVKVKKIQIMLLAVALVLLCFFSCFLSNVSLVCSALSIDIDGGYTDVLQDLSQDNSFNAENYSIVQNDYSLDVITIAESKDKELFIYVYQPSANYGNLVASYITISNAFHNANSNKLYKLTLLNCKGVFYKYIANDFIVNDDKTRYYDITDILRPFNADIDVESETNNAITNVTYRVAKQFTIENQNGNTITSVTGTDVVEITDKYVGFVRYKDNNAPSWINKDSCDNHFVAFSTDRQIDRLFEADVYYTHQSYHFHYELFNVYTKYGEIDDDGDNDNYAYLKYTEKHSYTGTNNGLFWHKNTYDWKEISSAKDFIANENRNIIYEKGIFNSEVETKLTDDGLANIQNKDWVLCFAQTAYNHDEHAAGMAGALIDETKTIIGDVKILRLKFETDGITYNLGVVDNMQSGSGMPDNYTNITYSFTDTFKAIIAILLLIILFIIFYPFISIVLGILFICIKCFFSLILAPLKWLKNKTSKK